MIDDSSVCRDVSPFFLPPIKRLPFPECLTMACTKCRHKNLNAKKKMIFKALKKGGAHKLLNQYGGKAALKRGGPKMLKNIMKKGAKQYLNAF
jgi:hypothetical protein